MVLTFTSLFQWSWACGINITVLRIISAFEYLITVKLNVHRDHRDHTRPVRDEY